MSDYCMNNPVMYFDPTGNRLGELASEYIFGYEDYQKYLFRK